MRSNVGKNTKSATENESNLPSVKKSRQKRRYKSVPPVSFHCAIIQLGVVVSFLCIYLLFFSSITITNHGPNSSLRNIPSKDEQIQPITLTPLRDVDLELYTIRINTWQRLEQLLVSIEHHATCPGVAQIQVVWCEDVDPPQQLVESHSKVVVERHNVNSLNERFRVLETTPTLGILSMDDDVLRPCEAIDSGFFKWTQNPHRMVGFDARTHVVQDDGTWKYGYMSTTEKSNMYSLSLPRYCFLHVDYLHAYMTILPKPIFKHVQQVFNCEDVAMSFLISRLTQGQPPLLADYWAIKSMVKLYSPERISGTKNHKSLRDACVNDFADILGLKGMLEKATLLHNKQQNLFECGAKGNEKPPSNWRLVERNADLQHKIHHWKHLSSKKAYSEITNLKSFMIRHAYVLGLIADTPPWKKRWKASQEKKQQ